MSLLKNSFGVTVEFNPKISKLNFEGKLTGSSLNRKKNIWRDLTKDSPIEALLKKPLSFSTDDDENHKMHTLSPRSKSKVRKKVIAFSRMHKQLSFVTLTFVNQVTDRQAIKILGAFLDNVSKRCNDFQYLWVVERQSKNKVFKDNIHFHLITNNYWKIQRWWNYWLDVQKKHGIIPRDENYKPSSAFDVKVVRSNNIKGIGNYITKYISKNEAGFSGMLWNCSRKISRLYTDFYSDMEFLTQLKKLEIDGLLKGKIQTFEQEYCTVHLVPLNNVTTHLYNRIDEMNIDYWGSCFKLKKKIFNEAK